LSAIPSVETPCYTDLSGRTVLVTGGGSGIGRGIALRLAAEGMQVLICGRRVERLEETLGLARETSGPHRAFAADLSRPEDTARLLDGISREVGRLDALVLNASAMPRIKEPQAITDPEWDTVLATNLGGAFRLCRDAYPLLRKSEQAAIVVISSVGGLRAHYRYLHYDVTKAGLNALVRGLALDYALDGIRVNGVAPGRIEDAPRAPEPIIPVGRSGTTAEVAAVVAFLLSGQSRYIAGQTIVVDGGLTAQLVPRERWI
jgi:NAD(P)-dependent dehydrogenase (short-subunit alcohol dehydrogenase family)